MLSDELLDSNLRCFTKVLDLRIWQFGMKLMTSNNTRPKRNIFLTWDVYNKQKKNKKN